MNTLDISCLSFSKPKPAMTLWSWRQRFHGDIVRRGRKAYRIVEKVGFFSYLAIPYKWHAHR